MGEIRKRVTAFTRYKDGHSLLLVRWKGQGIIELWARRREHTENGTNHGTKESKALNKTVVLRENKREIEDQKNMEQNNTATRWTKKYRLKRATWQETTILSERKTRHKNLNIHNEREHNNNIKQTYVDESTKIGNRKQRKIGDWKHANIGYYLERSMNSEYTTE